MHFAVSINYHKKMQEQIYFLTMAKIAETTRIYVKLDFGFTLRI